ncbi:hypothetical protein ACM46_18695 [Chryseobacterium angstadtii]|uniref:Uncharacterized protein n=1 Tax=Chryseobacterium angstadtii TaxID=558151 RepID=A0A0J7I1D9_9FLAO|nr:hypothetical protein [Chryseobacterium angstadtii]KMQ60243.1 hypothetical protein ACM46_18695 [Chryseobacterium angstadtii]
MKKVFFLSFLSSLLMISCSLEGSEENNLMKDSSEGSINKSIISKNQAIGDFKKALADANNPTLIKEEIENNSGSQGFSSSRKKILLEPAKTVLLSTGMTTEKINGLDDDAIISQAFIAISNQ